MKTRFVSVAMFAVIGFAGAMADSAQGAPPAKAAVVGGCEFFFGGQPAGSCVDYLSGAPATLQSFCAGNGHKYYAGGCPAALKGGNRVGSCAITNGAAHAPPGYGGPVTIRYYPPFGAATQQGACANNLGGSWTAK